MNLIVTSPGPAPGEAPMDTAGSSSGEGRASMKTLSGILKHITTTRATRQDDSPAASGFMPASQSPEQRVTMEINLYLSLQPLNANDDLLEWWNFNKNQFPLLANVAKKFLCIPATSVPSERAFSTSGYILSPLRSRLTVDRVNMLSFLHHNLP